MAEFIVNTYDFARARVENIGEFMGSLDSKRPTAWQQYGYKTDLTIDDYRRAYERGGAGHGAVHKLLGRCWKAKPRIKQPQADKETSWETKIAKSLTAINGWQKLMGFDRRNMVGRFAALIYRVADGKKLSEPLARAERLVDIIPLFEDQIRVTKWDEDTSSETYGTPITYQYRSRSPSSAGDTQAKPEQWVDVHHTRVQILAEGAEGSDFFEGVPLLRAGFNALVDIEKLSGGGGESALKNSARTIVFQYDTNSDPQQAVGASGEDPDEVKKRHEERVRGVNRNQDAAIVMQGGKAETLQTQVADLSPQFEISANIFAASVGMPFTIIFGQQTGRLASDEDQKEMNARAAARQDDTLTPMLTEFVTRMQACGVFEAGEFEIEWPDLGAPTDEQKIDKAKKMADTNQVAFNGGATEPVFDNDEIRKAAGYEERQGGGDQFKEETPPEPAPVDPGAKPAPAPATK